MPGLRVASSGFDDFLVVTGGGGGTLATSEKNVAEFLAASEFLVEIAVLGTYYFGYQLAVQPGRLFTTTVLNILVPVVKRLSHDKIRLAAVVRRLLSTGGFAIAAVNLSMLALIEPLEHLIWAEKWADTIFTVQVLSIGLTYTTILGIGTSPLMAERRYRENVICGVLRAVAVVLPGVAPPVSVNSKQNTTSVKSPIRYKGTFGN